MYSTYSKLLSVLLVLAFIYKKTEDRISLWILNYVLFFASSVMFFRFFFPGVPFISPTIEYLGFLVIVGIPFLALIIFIVAEIEKKKSNKTGFRLKVIFEPTRENKTFWAIILFINIVAFFLEKAR